MIAFYGWIFTFLSVWGLRWIIGIIGYNPTIRWWNCLLYSTGNPQIWAYNVSVFPVDVPFNQSIWHSFWNVFGSRRAKKGIRSWRYGGFLYPVGTPKLFILIGCSMMFHNKPSSYWGTPILGNPPNIFGSRGKWVREGSKELHPGKNLETLAGGKTHRSSKIPLSIQETPWPWHAVA